VVTRACRKRGNQTEQIVMRLIASCTITARHATPRHAVRLLQRRRLRERGLMSLPIAATPTPPFTMMRCRHCWRARRCSLRCHAVICCRAVAAAPPRGATQRRTCCCARRRHAFVIDRCHAPTLPRHAAVAAVCSSAVSYAAAIDAAARCRRAFYFILRRCRRLSMFYRQRRSSPCRRYGGACRGNSTRRQEPAAMRCSAAQQRGRRGGAQRCAAAPARGDKQDMPSDAAAPPEAVR